MKKEKLPKVGDKIYIDSSFSISHGEDDVRGGLATINSIFYNKDLPKDHINYIFIGVEEVPNREYNYRILLEEQTKLKKEFGKKKAHPDPDINTPWIQDGDIVNGSVYHGPDIW